MKTKIRKNKTGIIGIAAVIACAIVLVSATAFAEIVLEIHSNTADGDTTFTDSSLSSTTHSITANGGAKHSTATSKFGSSSMYFNGTGTHGGNYLSVPSSSDFGMETGDFTIDLWTRFNAIYSYQFLIGADDAGHLDIYYTTDGRNGFNANFEGSNRSFDVPSALVIDTWYHIALSRNGTDLRMFVDGIQIGSTLTFSDNIAATGLVIGRQFTSNYTLNGYLDDLYIRNGEGLSANEIKYISDLGGQSLEGLDPFERASVVSVGNDTRVDLTAGVATLEHTTYTTQDVSLLAQLYADGTANLSPLDVTIGGITWHYYDTLPDEAGRSVGAAYTYGENDYIYLGSSGIGETTADTINWDTITDAGSQFGNTWDSNDLQALLNMYKLGVGSSVVVDGTKWEYYSDLPEQGSYIPGQAYEWNGRKFIYLGSGIGEAPELPAGIAPLAMMMFGIVVRFRNRRRV